MSFEINRNVPANLLSKPLSEDQSLDARKAVNDLAKHIDVKAEGSRYPGRLRVHNLSAALKGDAQSIEIKRAGFFKNIFTSTNHVQRSSGYLRSLLGAAYKGKVSEEKYNDIMARVDKHLNKNLGFDGFGSRHFAKFVREFESAPQIFKNAPSVKHYDTETSSLLSSKIVKGYGPLAKNLTDVIKDLTKGLSSTAGVSGGEVDKIAEGSEGIVFSLQKNNRDRIIKINSFNAPDIVDNIRKGDVAASYFRNNDLQYLVLPERYIIEVKKDDANVQLYDVHRNELKSFVKEVKDIAAKLDQQIDLKILGTEMDVAKGQSLSSITTAGALNDQDFVSFAAGLYAGVEELRTRSFVHHDIKPANVMFDQQSGSIKLVDLGAMVKLSNKKDDLRQTNERMGSPPFQAPAAIKGAPHGAEVDRFSYAVTLLHSLEPKISSPATIRNLSSFFGGASTILNADGQPKSFAPSEYLTEYVRALKAAEPDAASQLEAKFEANPQFKALIEQSFIASDAGNEGRLAWLTVQRECFAACNLQPKDIQKLNDDLGNKYIFGDREILNDIFSESCSEKKIDFQLNDFKTDSLETKIKSAIFSESKKNGSLNSSLVTHEHIRPLVKKIVSDFIDGKNNIFSEIDSRQIDDNLKSILKEQFKLDATLKREHVEKLIDVVPKVAQFLRSIKQDDIRNNFSMLKDFRKSIENSLAGEGMDFQQSFLLAATQYASSTGVGMPGVFNTLMSQQSRDFYSALVTNKQSESSVLLNSIDNKEQKSEIGRAIDGDIAFINSLISSVSVHTTGNSINILDVIQPAQNISDAVRNFILNDLYPLK